VGQGIGELLTFAVGVVISPVPIIAVILMLFSARAKVNGPMFLLGWVVALAVVSFAVYFASDASDPSTSSGAADAISWGKVVLGALLPVLALRSWRNRPAPGEEPDIVGHAVAGILALPRTGASGRSGVAELPSGTVTFLFTDIEGSTRLWEDHQDAMKDALSRHDVILREPTAATVAASGPSGEVAATAGKLTWNKRVSLPRPPLTEDPVDKAAVSGFSDAPLRQPKALPRRWKLAQADVLRAEETAEGCPEVHIAYGVGQRVGRDFADTFQFPTTCARGLAGGQPLTIGPYQGTIATDESFQVPRTVAEFDADGTTIQVTTTLTPDEFAKVWGSLTALNLDKPPKANLPVASSSAT
jgi:hypothetical protein